MRLLLDTHTLLWWLGDDARLGPSAKALIANPENEVLVSAVSLWEIMVEVRIGKLDADLREVVETIGRQGFILLDIAPDHLVTLGDLPFHVDHRDPFDHLLIAQAIAENATFVSADRNASRYAVTLLPCWDPPAPPG